MERSISGVTSELEKRIIGAALASRGNYEEISRYVDSSAFSAIATVIQKGLEDYYSRDPDAGNCPKEVLVGRIRETISSEKHAESIASYLESVDVGVSVPNLLFDVRQLRRGRVGDKLAALLANRSSGPDVDKLVSEYQELGDERGSDADSDEDVFTGVSAGELISRHLQAGTYSFGLDSLDRATDGGARPGHHILVFARPEVGKTLVTLDIVSRQLRQGRTVLYVGNEDPIGDIVLRLIGRLTGLQKAEIIRDPSKADELAFGRGYGNFTGASLSPGSFRDIAKLLKEYPSEFIVIDQLRNIDVGDDNRVTALEKAAIGARNLAKSCGVVVVSVTQAGESAEGRTHLELSDIDFSKTGIPGAIDLAIGVGASQDDKRLGFRTINLPKNKLGGKHTSFQVKVDPTTGYVKEV